MNCQPFKRQPHKMIKHSQRIRRLLLAKYFVVFDHFVGLALKGLNQAFNRSNGLIFINRECFIVSWFTMVA